jgi:SHS2 domain-containing protein
MLSVAPPQRAGYASGMYELFEHTADLGLRATAPDLDALFAEMAACLFTAILEDPTSVRPTTAVAVEIAGTDREFLLFDWLKELLYRFDAEHQVFARFEVRVRPDGLSGTAWGEPLDPERHLLNHEVKAITYHELAVEPVEGGWRAEVIVDI